MRLNALHPEDNPMEALLFCFGGDGGGDSGGGDTQDDQMDDLDAISAEFDAMDDAYDSGESFTSEGVETGGGDSDSGSSADTQDAQMDELDAITQQFEDMNRAIEETGGAAIGGDGSVSGRGTEGYEAVADTYEGMTGDDSMTAGFPTEELTASLTPPSQQPVDALTAELDAITQQFQQMEDVIDAGQGVAVTGTGQVTSVDSYNEAKNEAVENAVNSFKNNPDFHSTTLNPNDPDVIADLEGRLSGMSLDEIDNFSRNMGGLEEGERSYTLEYNFGEPTVAGQPGEVEILPGDYTPPGFEDTFVSRDQIGTGVPVTSLPEGSYQLDPETNTVALNDVGREYMDELAKGYNDLPNKFGIDRQEIDSLMQQGELVGAPMVQVPTSSIGFAGAPEGGEAPAGEGEDEAGLAGGMGGAGRLGDDEVAQEGVEEFAYDYPAFFPSETGDQSQQAQSTSGLGISGESGGIGLLPGEGGVIGTDSGLIGQSGSGSLNPFTEGGGGGEGAEESVIPGQGEGQTGTGEGAGDGTGTGTPPTVADGGDGGDTTIPPVVEEPVVPYFFGEPMEFYDPNLPPFEYRDPLVTTPYDFARDFGSYTLSEPIAESYAQRALIAPEGLIPYTPEYMEPIAEMDELRQAELLSLIGERFPGEFGEFDYDMSVSPLESAQALISALGDQSS